MHEQNKEMKQISHDAEVIYYEIISAHIPFDSAKYEAKLNDIIDHISQLPNQKVKPNLFARLMFITSFTSPSLINERIEALITRFYNDNDDHLERERGFHIMARIMKVKRNMEDVNTAPLEVMLSMVKNSRTTDDMVNILKTDLFLANVHITHPQEAREIVHAACQTLTSTQVVHLIEHLAMHATPCATIMKQLTERANERLTTVMGSQKDDLTDDISRVCNRLRLINTSEPINNAKMVRLVDDIESYRLIRQLLPVGKRPMLPSVRCLFIRPDLINYRDAMLTFSSRSLELIFKYEIKHTDFSIRYLCELHDLSTVMKFTKSNQLTSGKVLSLMA